MAHRKLKVLVVDDSSLNRRSLLDLINRDPELEVTATAADGEEGLKAALSHRPDVITLDLHMPRVDGFTFLRLLMAKRPTPVVVISSYARKDAAFQALELGAIDFVARPGRPMVHGDAAAQELLAKLKGVRHLGEQALRKREPAAKQGDRLRRLAVIGASTGGPPAIAAILERLPADLPMAVVVAQHMPAKFTRAFADRLNRTSSFEVAEATDLEPLVAGRALIAQGGMDLLLRRSGGTYRARVAEPLPERKYHPSVDALFSSACELAPFGLALAGVVLTGMGNDGQEGIVALKRAGALTLAESQHSSVIFGMPREAIRTGSIDRVLDLPDLVEALVQFGRGGGDGASRPGGVW